MVHDLHDLLIYIKLNKLSHFAFHCHNNKISLTRHYSLVAVAQISMVKISNGIKSQDSSKLCYIEQGMIQPFLNR